MTTIDSTRKAPQPREANPDTDADEFTSGVPELLAQARSRLAEATSSRSDGRLSPTDQDALVSEVVADVVAEYATGQLMTGRVVPIAAQQRLSNELRAHLAGLAGLDALLADDSIEDIWCNGADNVWIRRANGGNERVGPVAGSDAELVDMVRALAASAGSSEQERRFDRAAPILDLRLAGGMRLHAVQAVAERPSVSIRRHRLLHATLDELHDGGTFTPDVQSMLAAAVRARFNLIIAGQTGAGKTTLLRALTSVLDPGERIVSIEDSYELGLDADLRHPNSVALQAREPNVEGEGAVGMRTLFRAGLRMNPSRVIVGEVRGDEAVDMLHAMSQGNNGSLSTIHASSSAGVFSKLELFGAAAPERLGGDVMARLIADAVDLVVHMGVSATGQRQVTSIREVVAADAGRVTSNELYRPGPDGAAVAGSPISQARADRLHEAGYRTTQDW